MTCSSIGCEPRRDGGASVAFRQSIWRDSRERRAAAACATVRVACLDAHSLKPRRLPEVILQELALILPVPEG